MVSVCLLGPRPHSAELHGWWGKHRTRRTGVSPEISSLSDKDNGSDLGPSSGFATLRRLSLLTSVGTAMTAASDSPAKGEICSGLQDVVRTWADVTMEMGNERLRPWLCL